MAGLKSRLRQLSFLRRLKRFVIGPRIPARPPGAERIREYVDRLQEGAELKVVFGGHWSDNPGWLLLTEADQDITTRLHFNDGSVDVVFSEHVIEHVPFAGGVHYFQECARILKSGGICRTVCPMLDRMMQVDFHSENEITYIENSLKPFHSDANHILTELDLGGLQENALPFFFAALYMGHEHRFIWTSDLMTNVMKAVGFREARRVDIGEAVGLRCASSAAGVAFTLVMIGVRSCGLENHSTLRALSSRGSVNREVSDRAGARGSRRRAPAGRRSDVPG